eukprot:TRINITY_DN3754_c1_g1_i1.p1 TRINITY_DN3754_c1_g1~~TRINITY_DN3754_c1_g1_i1.p1  ORF type:complete len:585 (+),score=184.66 TRINITY_DN3754_c1_g1_i1:60-1757(+)
MPKPPRIDSLVPRVQPGPKAVLLGTSGSAGSSRSPPEDCLASEVDRATSSVVFGTELKVTTQARSVDQRREPERKRLNLRDLELKERLGNGHFGVVRRGVLKGTGESFAVKQLFDVHGRNSRELSSELRQLTVHHSAHIVRTHLAYYSKSTGCMSIVMEYMRHGSLDQCREKLHRRGVSFTLADVRGVGKAVLNALWTLRNDHALHRDVKPANILVGAGGDVKLADFGVSCVTDPRSEAFSECGTRHWMSPERLRCMKYSYPSDIYSLGLVLGWMMLGVHPLPVYSPQDVIFNTDTAPDGLMLLDETFSTPGAGVTAAGADVVYDCTRLQPEDRATAPQLLRSAFLAGHGTQLPMLKTLSSGGAAEPAENAPPERSPDHSCTIPLRAVAPGPPLVSVPAAPTPPSESPRCTVIVTPPRSPAVIRVSPPPPSEGCPSEQPVQQVVVIVQNGPSTKLVVAATVLVIGMLVFVLVSEMASARVASSRSRGGASEALLGLSGQRAMLVAATVVLLCVTLWQVLGHRSRREEMEPLCGSVEMRAGVAAASASAEAASKQPGELPPLADAV